MKKTLLAAALTVGFFGVAQAETSVTLYGILDGGIGYQKVDGNIGGEEYTAKKTGIINGVQYGNRWGLKGAEDLGNGLRAVFQLESGFDLGDGQSAQGGRLFGRQATLGLASDAWGRLDIGRQTNIASKYVAGVASPFGASFMQANAGAVLSSANTVRWDNMVMYQTPNFSGFQFGVGYSFNTNGAQNWDIDLGNGLNPDDDNVRGITTGLRYENGPIGVALSYDQARQKNRVANPDGTFGVDSVTVSEWNLAGSYDFEVAKLHLAFGQTRNGLFAGQGYGPSDFEIDDVTYSEALSYIGVGDGFKANSYIVGVSAPIGAGTLMASWQMADPRSASDAYEAVAGNPDLEKQQTYSLGYTYDISKRTNVYAIGSYAKNVLFQDDLKSTLVGVGLVHKF